MSGIASSMASTSAPPNTDLSNLVSALDVIYNPRSSNEDRKNATLYLEEAKAQPGAASHGFALAIDTSHPAVVRHYGLSLLEFSVKYKWHDLLEETGAAVTDWVFQLAKSVGPNEPSYLRNKIAQIWIEIAETCWIERWNSMDEMLTQLWEASPAHQAIVLYILESLSEDSVAKDKGDGVPQTSDLFRACSEIFNPLQILNEQCPDRAGMIPIRCGTMGWMDRLWTWLRGSLAQPSMTNTTEETCVQVMRTLHSVMPWIVLRSIIDCDGISLLAKALGTGSTGIRTAALEVLYALYHRPRYSDSEVVALACPFLTTQGISLLRRSYESIMADLEDLDDLQYLCLRRHSEVMCSLSSFLEQRPNLVVRNSDLRATLDFLLVILQNPSHVASIPVLHSISKLFVIESSDITNGLTQLIGPLLEICRRRLLKCEYMASESSDITLRFLTEDFDTIPERHAFVGNYRRYCATVVERIVDISPFEAMQYILSQVDDEIVAVFKEEQSFDPQQFNSYALRVLQVDAQASLVTSAVKGYLNWLQFCSREKAQEQTQAREQVFRDLENWCNKLLSMECKNPAIQKRIEQLLCEITTSFFPLDSPLPIRICERIFEHSGPSVAPSTLYGEAVRELVSYRPRMLQKLAMRFADLFMKYYEQIEAGVNRIFSQNGIEAKLKAEYQSALLISIQRSSSISDHEKHSKLKQMTQPIIAMWRNEDFARALEDFGSFCQLLGIEEIPEYFLACKAHSLADWSSYQLDERGKQLREKASSQPDTLPLQLTRSLLAASTDRVRPRTPEFDSALAQWRDGIPVILPNLLRLLGHSHGFGSPEKWSNFPDQMRVIVQRLLVDRVWQSGISSETREDFFVKIRDSRTKLEGLASATRAAVRGVREQCYWILHCMSQFGDAFYGHLDLPEPLANALYDDASSLSSHQTCALLKLTGTIVDGCPPASRGHYLPPLITKMLVRIDQKLISEWESMEQKTYDSANEQGLDQEMKSESVLRGLTGAAVNLVSSWIKQRAPKPNDYHKDSPSIFAIILGNHSILSNLIPFCTHVLRMRDSRSCVTIIQALRDLLAEVVPASISSQEGEPRFEVDKGTAIEIRDYIASEVLKAAITSLNESYFADIQRELAALIGAILSRISPHSQTPRGVLLSLPNMSEDHVDSALRKLTGLDGEAGETRIMSERKQKTFVLDFLEGLRGKAIAEQGKIFGSDPRRVQKDRKTNNQAWMPLDGQQQQQQVTLGQDGQSAGLGITRGESPELTGVAEMFG
ncbi:MAG: hypothetical protein M1831_006521 [Alyxoria varia]|nr:MAG: hypothetical protein M1831_006521 [Alyxoria varia]